jgi:hypothetical protein
MRGVFLSRQCHDALAGAQVNAPNGNCSRSRANVSARAQKGTDLFFPTKKGTDLFFPEKNKSVPFSGK